MSLLMDALRKAEEAKSKGEKPDPASADQDMDSASQEVLEAVDLASLEDQQAREIIPDNSEIETISFSSNSTGSHLSQADPGNKAQPSSASVSSVAAAAGRAHRHSKDRKPQTIFKTAQPTPDQLAAATVFAAKQNPEHKGSHVKFLLTIVVLLMLSTSAIFWFINNSVNSSIMTPALLNIDISGRGSIDDLVTESAPASIKPERTTQAALTRTSVSKPPADMADTATAASQLPAQQTSSQSLINNSLPTPDTAAVIRAGAGSENSNGYNVTLSTEPAKQTPFIISRSTATRTANPALTKAYQLFQSGNFDAASILYAQVLAEQPLNRDALIAMAAIDIKTGNLQSAQDFYVRILELNPQDAYARIGLLQTLQDGNALGMEQELQQLLGRYETVAPLHFVLGNHYAENDRWQEAQAAYFQAYYLAQKNTQVPVSPDYPFNLAVSLERLQQPAVALPYYQQAAQLSQISNPGFDPELLQSRLNYLEQNLP